MVRVSFPYRSTLNGGFDFVYVFSDDGKLIEPVEKWRTKTGRHGYDVYELSGGWYFVVHFSRPNNPNKPITVRYIELVVGDNDYCLKENISESRLPQAVMLKVRKIYEELTR